MSYVNADKIKLHFPHTIITKILGKPTHSSVQTLTQQLYENSAAITSTLGGGAHGDLGLMIKTEEYKT